MPISILCPGCKSKLVLADNLAGKAVRCSKCQAVCKVPAADRLVATEKPAGAPTSDFAFAPPRSSPAPRRSSRAWLVGLIGCGALLLLSAGAGIAVGVVLYVQHQSRPGPDSSPTVASAGGGSTADRPVQAPPTGAKKKTPAPTTRKAAEADRIGATTTEKPPETVAAKQPEVPPAAPPPADKPVPPPIPAEKPVSLPAGRPTPPAPAPAAPPEAEEPVPPPPAAEKPATVVLLSNRAVAGNCFTYQLPQDGPDSQFQLVSGPPGMSMTAKGYLIWAVAGDLKGVQEFSVRVTTAAGQTVRRYQVEVLPAVVRAPSSPPPAGPTFRMGEVLPEKATTGKPFAFQLPGDAGQTFTVLRAPTGLAVSATGRLTWTPPPGPAREEMITVRTGATGVLVFKIAVEEDKSATLALPRPGGWVLLPDGSTLIVSLTEQAKLVYIDTVAHKEIKRVDLGFKPAALAVQGKQLFVGVQGAALLHILDVDSGEDKKEIKVPEGAVFDLVCHPEKGLVYATTTTRRVVAIHPTKQVAVATPARGMFLAIDPVKGDTLYSAIQPQIQDVLVIQELSRGRLRISNRVEGDRALLAKMTITKNKQLQVASVNTNAAANGYLVRVSGNGKRVAVVGGGGYRPPAGAAAGNIGSYGVGVFGTDDITSLVGQVEVGAYPNDLAFHPVLDIGAAEQVRSSDPGTSLPANKLHLFNSRSLGKIDTIILGSPPPGRAPAMPEKEGRLLTFAARGTKLLYYDGSGTGALRSIAIPLSDADKEALKKAYGAEKKKPESEPAP